MVETLRTEAELLAAIADAEKRVVAHRRLDLVNHPEAATFSSAEDELVALFTELHALHAREAAEEQRRLDEAEIATAKQYGELVNAYKRLRDSDVSDVRMRYQKAAFEAEEALNAIRPTPEEVALFKPSADRFDRLIGQANDGTGRAVPPEPLIHNDSAPDAPERRQRARETEATRQRIKRELDMHEGNLAIMLRENPELRYIP